MQKLKSKVFEKFQIKKVASVWSWPRNPAFQMFGATLLTVGLLPQIKIQPLGLIFFMILCSWFFKTHCTLRLQIPPEFENHVGTLQCRVVKYRQARPTMFCAIASGCLTVLAVIGNFVSGSVVVLTGLILAVIITTKYNIKVIKIELNGLNFGWSEKLPEFDFDDEFLPEETESNMSFLEKANDLSSRIEDAEDDESKSDEVPSELLIPDAIPEVNESSTDDDQNDLLPIVPMSKSETRLKNSNPAKDALVKYSHSNDAIEYKKGYFKRDSSLSTSASSSEESLSKGLQFPDHTTVDGYKALRPADMTESMQEVSRLGDMIGPSQGYTFISNNSKITASLMSALVQGVLGVGVSDPTQHSSNRRLVTALDSSDESDFEILEQEDFQ